MRTGRRIIALAVTVALTLLVAMPASAAPPSTGYTTEVQGTAKNIETGDVTTFDGTATIDRVFVQDGRLMASGVIDGTTGAGQAVEPQNFTAPLSVGVQQSQDSCEILNLDLGPINLDVLGLVVDVSPISIDITAVPGAGNLLGNLLCAVAGLLDGSGGGALNGIAALLNRILGLLG